MNGSDGGAAVAGGQRAASTHPHPRWQKCKKCTARKIIKKDLTNLIGWVLLRGGSGSWSRQERHNMKNRKNKKCKKCCANYRKSLK